MKRRWTVILWSNPAMVYTSTKKEVLMHTSTASTYSYAILVPFVLPGV